jgi:hypothetical protein
MRLDFSVLGTQHSADNNVRPIAWNAAAGPQGPSTGGSQQACETLQSHLQVSKGKGRQEGGEDCSG